LTGTPIQNTLADLGALVAFLGMPILKDPTTFRKYIDGSSNSSKLKGQNDFKNLRLLLESICLRRSKTILPLFGLKMEERRVQFSTREREQYRLLELKFRRAIDMAVSGHHNKETHQRVIEWLLRLRLFCNNGLTYESDKSSTLPRNPDELLSLLQLCGDAVCQYCFCDVLSMSASESANSVHLTECRQLVCDECMTRYLEDLRNAQQNGKHICPFCDGEHSMENLLPRETGESLRTFLAVEDYPSKLVALLKDMQTNSMQEKWDVLLDFLS
jgi:SWI/SNF-related matrix-associated actin-dependent regulator of chromatin subfamily A3